MDDLLSQIQQLKEDISKTKEYLDKLSLDEDISKMEAETQKEGFWDDPKESQKLIQVLNFKKGMKESYEELVKEVEDMLTLYKMYEEETDGELTPEYIEELSGSYEKTHKKYKQFYVSLFLSGKYDQGDVLLSLSAGTGGTDAQDFTEMLLRMYIRYAEEKGYKVTLFDKNTSPEAGIKSATIEISGPMAYGYLKAEKGIHRLIRLSPFNAKNLRQTSFAMVEVIPVIEENDEFPAIPDSDIKMETFRASGAGGQHVNVTDSAVRITHIPTGIVVQCQNERSQLQNKQQAMKVLQARLLDEKRKEEEKQMKELKGEHKEADFGNQIRTYTLHPYKMVKDHRTNVSVNNVEAVLDGDLDDFIEAWLTK